MSSPLTFPTLVYRLVKGAELTFAEGDGNLKNIQAFSTALANLIAASLNPDGTLVANSVNAAAIQDAAVSLANLNPSLLYNIVPVDTDTGATTGAYVITARGGLGGTNLIPGGAVYDVNGNYTINNLTLNYGYYWTKGAHDISCIGESTLTVSGSFTALETSVVLTGVAGQTVTATLVQTAPINSYIDGMMFFVYTTRSNFGAATLNVNNLGAIPIQLYGQGLASGAIQAPGVFAVVYKAGVFVLFSGATAASGNSGSGSTTVVNTVGYSGVNTFSMPTVALAGAYPTLHTTAHGLGVAPTTFVPSLICITADSGFAAGQVVPLGEFVTGVSPFSPAFSWSSDASNIYITEQGAPKIINPTTGAGPNAITTANWLLQATATAFVSFAGVAAFPALTYSAANPKGAFTFGSSLFIFNQAQFNSSDYFINKINLVSSEVTPVADQVSTFNYNGVNGCVFGTGFFTTPNFVFMCSGGLYKLPVVNPGTNYISGGTAYNGSGNASTASLPNGTYTWTPGANDTSLTINAVTYQATSAVNGTLSITVAGGPFVGALVGAPGTVVTGTLISGTGGWIPTLVSTHGGTGTRKPAWYVASPEAAYIVSSDIGDGSISSLSCFKITSTTSQSDTGGGKWTTTSTVHLDLTSNLIANITPFHSWYPVSCTAPIQLFQYNPITKRIYVITQQMAMIHIFNITAASNDFSAWWDSTQANREGMLSYTKSLAIGGNGAEWSTSAQAAQCHYTVEFDQNTGKEICLAIVSYDGTTNNTASIVRIPWVE